MVIFLSESYYGLRRPTWKWTYNEALNQIERKFDFDQLEMSRFPPVVKIRQLGGSSTRGLVTFFIIIIIFFIIIIVIVFLLSSLTGDDLFYHHYCCDDFLFIFVLVYEITIFLLIIIIMWWSLLTTRLFNLNYGDCSQSFLSRWGKEKG